MPAASDSTPLDVLLEHQAFVRVLARRLLGDEHAGSDLAQDMWTDLLVNPPRAVRSVRACAPSQLAPVSASAPDTSKFTAS